MESFKNMLFKHCSLYEFLYDIRLLRYPIFLPLFDIALINGKPIVKEAKGKLLYFKLIGVLIILTLGWLSRYLIKNTDVAILEFSYKPYLASVFIISYACLLKTISTQKDILKVFESLNIIDQAMNHRFSIKFSSRIITLLLHASCINGFIMYFIEIYVSQIIFNRSLLDIIHTYVYLVATVHRSLPMFFVTAVYILVLKKLNAINALILDLNNGNKSERIVVDSLNCFMMYHRKLVECVNITFKVYGLPIALNLLLTTIPAAMVLAASTMFNPKEIVEISIFAAGNFIVVMPVCCMAYNVIEKFKKIGISLCEVDISYRKQSVAKLILHDEINNTAGGLFKIDGTLIPVLFSGIGSGALFIIQINNVYKLFK